jgi:hypothetical protein
MQEEHKEVKWHQTPRKRLPHWSILTLDDLDKTNWKNRQMVIKLQAQYKASKERDINKPNQKAADF